jgi:hypothetical protein
VSKKRACSTIVLFLGFSALLFAGQFITSDDNDPNAKPGLYVPPVYQATPSFVGPGEMPTLANTTKTLLPYDDDGNCTVMSFYNPTLANAPVKMTYYDQFGATILTGSFNIPRKTLVRLCSDIVTTTSITWTVYILANFTPSTAYVKFTYPSTLKITSYIAWQGNFTYDPNVAVPTLPLSLY